jgi:hypothetical protein
MEKRTIGIIATAFTALCCGCLALFSCIWGGMIAAGVPVTTTVNGVESVETYPPLVGVSLLCVSLILIIIPLTLGIVTARIKPAAAAMPVSDEPFPPAL